MIVIAGILIAIVLLAPLAMIWALNTLFSLHIAFTFWTWLAALVLGALVSHSGTKVSK